MKYSSNDLLGNSILSAFVKTNKRRRTTRGVAKDTGIPYEEINKYIQMRPDMFERSIWRGSGDTLYGLTKFYRKDK